MRRIVGAVAVLGMLTLAGCGGGDPIPTLPPTPSAAPVFASEEEALAAAEQAYSAYLAGVNQALQTLDDAGLELVATDSALQGVLDSIADLTATGSRQVGEAKLASVRPTDLGPLLDPGVPGDAQVYVCLDLSSVGIQDADGAISQSGIPLFPMLVALRFDGGKVLVAQEDVWDGDNFCD
jgi:hypothetical protein